MAREGTFSVNGEPRQDWAMSCKKVSSSRRETAKGRDLPFPVDSNGGCCGVEIDDSRLETDGMTAKRFCVLES
jgi:hypothetical protein